MIFAIVSILALSAVCGKLCARVFEKREKFFMELENMCMFFKNEVGFLNTKNAVLFEKYEKSYEVENKQIFEEMKEISNESINTCFEKIYFLKKIEKQKLAEFSKNFGKGDQNSQLANIENFLQEAKRMHDESLQKKKQNAPLCYKVCLAIGTVICVLIL